MPVYGKRIVRRAGREEPAIRVPRGPLSEPIDRQTIVRRHYVGDPARWFHGIFEHTNEATPLERVEKRCGPVSEEIRTRIGPGKSPPVILDWGCGRGTALTEIAKLFPESRCYGFSAEFYDDWRSNESATFIHAVREDLPRYLKDNSVAVIFSHVGMTRLGNDEFLDELDKILPKLKRGGKMFLYPFQHELIEIVARMPGIRLSLKPLERGFQAIIEKTE